MSPKKNAYQTKIEKKLAEFSVALDPVMLVKIRKITSSGGMSETWTGEDMFIGKGWLPTRFYYAVGKIDCQLCGHANLKRVFVIKSKTDGKELHIGSECATNYLDADVVAGLCKIYDLEYNKIVNPVKYELDIPVLEWANTEGRKYARYSVLSNRRYALINGGAPASILYKISGGKNIGKREREVIDFWKDVKENAERYDAEEVALKAAREAESAKWNERHLVNSAFRELAYFFGRLSTIVFDQIEFDRRRITYKNVETKFDLALANAANENEKKFVEDMRYNDAQGRTMSVAQQRWFDSIYGRNNETKVDLKPLIEKCKGANLDAWEKSFVESVAAYYDRNGTLSPKQIKVLNRIEKKVA